MTKEKKAPGVTIYNLTMKLTEDMLGTVPYDQEVYKTFIESKKPVDILEAESDTVKDEIEKKGWTGFHKDDEGLFVFDYLIKGFVKNAANTLKGEDKAQRSLVNKYLFIFPRRVYLGVKVPDGVLERPLQAQTMQGPRVTLARSDTVKAGTEIKCKVHVLDSDKISEKRLREWLDYGQYMGLGQFRSGSYGRFTYELVKQK